jgi:hypothetical protein
MRLARLIIVGCALLFAQNAAPAQTASAQTDLQKFDEFGEIGCESEMARLDQFLIELQNQPAATAYVIYYGGRRYGTRLPRAGEAQARAARISPYLTKQRGFGPERLIIIDGGFRERWTVELWIIPSGVPGPAPTPTLKRQDIKFRRGKVTAREFRVQCT